MRRAEWRPLPRDPRSPLAWWWRDIRFATWGVATCLLILLLVGLFAPARLGFAVLGLAIACLYAEGLAFSLRKWRAGPWDVASLAPSPAPAEPFPVEFAFFSEELCTGRDQGVASFVEGWLHVEGLRTTFSLRPIDTTRTDLSKEGSHLLDLPGGQRIEIRSLASRMADRDTFAETFRVWCHFAVASLCGEPLLPPLRVHPSAFSRPLTLVLVRAALIAALLASSLWLDRQVVAGLLIVGLFIEMVGKFSVSDAIVSLRRLRALDKASGTDVPALRGTQE